ncbi:MAG: PLP-dependent transferase, partial [Bacteroidota bacterium]
IRTWRVSRLRSSSQQVRMEKQTQNAQQVADFLQQHPLVDQVYYLGLLEPGTPAYSIYKSQYTAPGAMISFTIRGGEKEAFTFLNHLRLFHLAVSLGSTESLAQHPATMTHVGVDPETRQRLGITEQLVRLSIGVENATDLIWDVEQALVEVSKNSVDLAKNPLDAQMDLS